MVASKAMISRDFQGHPLECYVFCKVVVIAFEWLIYLASIALPVF